MNSQDKELALQVLKKLDEVKDRMHGIELDQAKRLGEIEKVLLQQENNLDLHMKRSDSLEQQVQILEKEVKPVLDSLRSIKIIFTILSGLMTLLMVWVKLRF